MRVVLTGVTITVYDYSAVVTESFPTDNTNLCVHLRLMYRDRLACNYHMTAQYVSTDARTLEPYERRKKQLK